MDADRGRVEETRRPPGCAHPRLCGLDNSFTSQNAEGHWGASHRGRGCPRARFHGLRVSPSPGLHSLGRLTCGGWGPLKGRQEGSASDHAGAPQGCPLHRGRAPGSSPWQVGGGLSGAAVPVACALVRGLWTSLNGEEQQEVSLSVCRFAISVPSGKYQGSAREKGKWKFEDPQGRDGSVRNTAGCRGREESHSSSENLCSVDGRLCIEAARLSQVVRPSETRPKPPRSAVPRVLLQGDSRQPGGLQPVEDRVGGAGLSGSGGGCPHRLWGSGGSEPASSKARLVFLWVLLATTSTPLLWTVGQEEALLCLQSRPPSPCTPALRRLQGGGQARSQRAG